MNETSDSISGKRFDLIKFISNPQVFYFSLFYLVAVLTAGTLSQSTLGIYEANERYFAAWITWCFDRIPVPGGRLVLALMSINLLCKLLLNSRWKLKSMGVNIAHIGTLLLMLGALLTAYFSTEGSMYIVEGGSSRYYQDDEHLALSIVDTSPARVSNVAAFSGRFLEAGATISHDLFPGTITVEAFYRNMQLEFDDSKPAGEWRGMAVRQRIVPQALKMNPNENQAAAVLRVSGCDDSANGRYIVAQVDGPATTVRTDGRAFELRLAPRVYQLPGDLRFELVDFIAEYYPGTRTPKHYASKLRIHENGTVREATIQMNEPFRIHDLTFFQSSFEQRNNGTEATILSVVKNYGRMFPYIASIVICIGIGLHLLLHYPAYLKDLVKRLEQE